MPVLGVGKKRTFVFFAVPAGERLGGLTNKQEFLKELRKSGESIPADDAKKTVFVFPWEWNAPADFANAQSVLNANSWNEVCMYIANNYGSFKYAPKRCKTFHAISRGGDFALFKITVKVKPAN